MPRAAKRTWTFAELDEHHEGTVFRLWKDPGSRRWEIEAVGGAGDGQGAPYGADGPHHGAAAERGTAGGPPAPARTAGRHRH